MCYDNGLCGVYVTFLRLTNSSFCPIWAIMNHFNARLMVVSQKADSKVLKMAIYGSQSTLMKAKWRLQCLKFQTVLLWYEFRCTNSHKSTFSQVTLNFELDKMDIGNRHSQSDFALFVDFHCVTKFVKGINLLYMLYKASLWCVLLRKRPIYTSNNYQRIPLWSSKFELDYVY